MGHRTYLIKSSPDTAVVLFEANNFLPFFWLTLIGEEDVKRAESAMRKRFTAIQETDEDNFPPEYSNIRVLKEDALGNADLHSEFLEENYPEIMPLYRGFITFLDKNTTDLDALELDVFALSGFNDIDTLLEHIKTDLNALLLDEPEKISGYFSDGEITTLIGYGDFPGADANQYKYKPTHRPQPVKANPVPTKKPSIPGAIGTIGIGIAFLYIPYRGYHKEGISFTVSFCLLVALVVIYMGIKQLLGAIRK